MLPSKQELTKGFSTLAIAAMVTWIAALLFPEINLFSSGLRLSSDERATMPGEDVFELPDSGRYTVFAELEAEDDFTRYGLQADFDYVELQLIHVKDNTPIEIQRLQSAHHYFSHIDKRFGQDIARVTVNQPGFFRLSAKWDTTAFPETVFLCLSMDPPTYWHEPKYSWVFPIVFVLMFVIFYRLGVRYFWPPRSESD